MIIAGDQGHILALVLMLCKPGDHTPDRRNTGAACDDDQLLAFVVLQIEAVAVGTTHQEAVAHIMLKNFVCDLTHPADGQIHKAITDTADGNGRFAVLWDGHLKEHHPIQFNNLVLSGSLWAYLADLNDQAKQRMDTLIAQLKAAESITEALKAADPIAWVQRMNNITARAEEIIREELIYNG